MDTKRLQELAGIQLNETNKITPPGDIAKDLRKNIVFRYDEFSVMINPETEWVYLVDGEGTDRVTMPLDVWNGLVQKYMEQRSDLHRKIMSKAEK